VAEKISRRSFERIATIGLLVGAVAVYRLSPTMVDWLVADDSERPTAMAALAVALTALGVTILWAAVMLPIRARSELTPLGEELAAIRARGGMLQAVREERRQLDDAGRSADPRVRRRHDGRMAAAGLFLSSLGALASYVLWADGELLLDVALFTVVAAVVTLYYAARWALSIRAR
jgi:hypothetical protein